MIKCVKMIHVCSYEWFKWIFWLRKVTGARYEVVKWKHLNFKGLLNDKNVHMYGFVKDGELYISVI